MKNILSILTFTTLLLVGCSERDENPVQSTNVPIGTWEAQFTVAYQPCPGSQIWTTTDHTATLEFDVSGGAVVTVDPPSGRGQLGHCMSQWFSSWTGSYETDGNRLRFFASDGTPMPSFYEFNIGSGALTIMPLGEPEVNSQGDTTFVALGSYLPWGYADGVVEEFRRTGAPPVDGD